jgi:murein L,D-transpeptidase YcbB/YkuD
MLKKGMKLKTILLACMLSMGMAFAAQGFAEVEKQDQEAFGKEMSVEIKKQLEKAPKYVKYLYKVIDYQPIWVDKDYLSYHTEMLLSELKNDFKKGLHKDLVSQYKALMPDENKAFASDSIEDKAKIEIGIMKLYAKSIDSILKNKKSKYDAVTLLKKAVEEKSIMSAIDEIADERIVDATFQRDLNLTVAETKQAKYRALAARLIGKDKDDRLKAMYELLDFKPIWVTEEGLTEYTKTLFSHIESDITLEKNSTIYNEYMSIKNAEVPTEKEAIAKKEFEIAKLYQDFMAHQLYGDINWKKFQHTIRTTMKHGVWRVHPILETPEGLLIESLKHKSLDYAFKKAKPAFNHYDRMLDALKKYKEIAANGGWEKLPHFKSLKPGMRSSVVPALRQRLAIEGDYVCDRNETGNHYKGCLVDAVKKFQLRHGLEAAGFVGKMTRKALNVTAQEKVAKLKLNLDRIKWIKRDHDKYHIYVNIPSFTMYMYDGKEVIRSMRVITGRKEHETPIFYGRVRTIVLNPYWRIPPSIIRHETVPKLQKDPGYTDKKNIEIHTGYSEHSPKVDPHSVNWHKYGKKLPPYRFMQSPGEKNALGKVKYLFPNKYSVYMHDTNQRYLFVKDYRALSHGCVRLHKPFELLETLAEIEPKIDGKRAKEILAENKKTPYRLSKSIPVDIVYLTTLVDKEGTVTFYDDVYGYDKLQLSMSKQ